jgi:hypothetical protein
MSSAADAMIECCLWSAASSSQAPRASAAVGSCLGVKHQDGGTTTAQSRREWMKCGRDAREEGWDVWASVCVFPRVLPTW